MHKQGVNQTEIANMFLYLGVSGIILQAGLCNFWCNGLGNTVYLS